MQDKNLQHFDAWASTFGETVTAIELAPEGTGYRAKTRFARFFNLPELMSMFKDVADIQTADMLNLPTPEPHYKTVAVEPTEIQKLKEGLNATTLLIRRPGDDETETSNHADAGVFNYEYDLTIENNSDIIDLEKKAKEFIEYMRGAPHYEYDN